MREYKENAKEFDIEAVKPMKSTEMNQTDDRSQFPRIAFVTFSHLGPSHRWHDVLLPAAELFVPDVFYVVMTLESRIAYENLTRTDPAFRNSTVQPIFVDCPEAKSGESPCCKQEKGLLQFHDEFYYNDQKERQYEWILFMDDDTYIRSDELQIFVAELPLHQPIVLASSTPPGHCLGHEGYLRRFGQYRCTSTSALFRYPWAPWGQPAGYNQAAF